MLYSQTTDWGHYKIINNRIIINHTKRDKEGREKQRDQAFASLKTQGGYQNSIASMAKTLS